MNRKIIILLFAAILCFGISYAYKIHKTHIPIISSVEGSVFDWGVVDEGVALEHVFTIMNRGKTELVIENIRESCGCSSVEISREKLAPNETAELKVKYVARNRPDRETITVWVFSNDKTTTVKEFTMTGMVQLAVTSRPSSLSFDLTTGGEIESQALNFQRNIGEIELVHYSAPSGIKIDWKKIDRGYICHVKPDPKYRGPVTQRIIAEFKVDDMTKTLNVPIFVLQ